MIGTGGLGGPGGLAGDQSGGEKWSVLRNVFAKKKMKDLYTKLSTLDIDRELVDGALSMGFISFRGGGSGGSPGGSPGGGGGQIPKPKKREFKFDQFLEVDGTKGGDK